MIFTWPKLFSCFVLSLLLSGSATPSSGSDYEASLAAEAGSHGAKMLQQGRGAEATHAFRLAGRLQPSLWQAHYSLGASLLTNCQCSRALVSYSRALAVLRQNGGSAAHQAAVLKAQATCALPIAKVATNSTHQMHMLELVAASLEKAFALHPEPQSPLYEAVLKSRGRGGLHHLLLLSSGGECVSIVRAQAVASVSHW